MLHLSKPCTNRSVLVKKVKAALPFKYSFSLKKAVLVSKLIKIQNAIEPTYAI